MKSSIVIGPIQKAKPVAERSTILSERLSKMKVGNFFEVSGLSDKNDVQAIRASLQYFSKKRNIRVATVLSGEKLRVERIKLAKTKETSEVK
jgi:hypothetical protein